MAITQWTDEYRVEEDKIQLFIDQCLEQTDAEYRLSATEVYEVYQVWHKKYVNAKSVPSMHLFGRQLSAKVERRKVGGHTYYFGYDLSEEGEAMRPVSK